jgi:hypothetical protein
MNFFTKYFQKVTKTNSWARPNMKVTFRAEIMPGKGKEERTFTISKVLWNDRVILDGFAGEHRESEFEPVLKN